jgi:hypothetical protein
MASTLVFLVVRHVLGLVNLGPKPDDKDVEIAVLRHQLAALHRQVARPRCAPTDRLVLATLARLLPRERWSAFLVTPATLLRWHRELVRRRWTYRHEPRVQRGLDPALVELVLRLARENPRWGYLRICGECATAFEADGVRVVKTPVRAPRANAYAERWVRSVRAECLDWTLIWNRRHLERMLAAYVDHHNLARPHPGIGLEVPAVTEDAPLRTGPIERIDVLGGLIHEYHRAA